jgi:hypothetical protein
MEYNCVSSLVNIFKSLKLIKMLNIMFYAQSDKKENTAYVLIAQIV